MAFIGTCAQHGAQTIEGDASRVRFVLNDVVGTFHHPHPAKEAKPYQVRDARQFLEQAGVTRCWLSCRQRGRLAP
jgi:HicA toxin of bacterial toxin-antitoxin,